MTDFILSGGRSANVDPGACPVFVATIPSVVLFAGPIVVPVDMFAV